jgi:hypothetical protein
MPKIRSEANDSNETARLHFDYGLDADLVAGYDFGLLRARRRACIQARAGLDQVGFF